VNTYRPGRVIPTLPVLAWLASASLHIASGAPVLPKYGFSVPAEADPAEVVKAVRDCGAKSKIVMLPPVSIRLGGPSSAVGRREALERLAAAMPPGAEVFVRLQLDLGGLGQSGGPQQEQRITQLVAGAIDLLPLSPANVRGLLVEVEGALPAPELLHFALANLTVKAKAGRQNLELVVSFPAGFVQAHPDLVAKLGTYVDALGTVFAPGWETEMTRAAELALNKPMFLKLGGELPAEQVASGYLDAVMAAVGTSVDVIWLEQPGLPGIARLCTAANFVAGFLTQDFTPMGAALAPFAITLGGAEAGPQRLFAAGRSPNVVMLAKLGASQASPKTIDLRGAPGEQFEMEWYDPIAGARLTAGKAVASAAGIGQSCRSQSDYLLLLMRKTGAAGQRLYADVQVTEKAELKAEEVIARWQQYKESQRQALANHTASCFMNLHFEPANMGSGFDVSMRFQQYVKRDGPTEWAQTEFYVNGVRFKKRWEFPLPQLEPEKVLTQPLDLKLNEKYSYRMLGTEDVNGVASYVLGVEPKEQEETLYSGKIWIDSKTFRQVRMALTQRGAKGSVIANQETQNFALVSDGKGREFNLIKSIYAQQTLNAAGRSFVLQKTYNFSDYAINRDDFEGALAATRLSDNPMYRDTETGLRTLKKQGTERIEQPAGQKRVRSIVTGVMYGGTFNIPIPLFGISLVDFNFRNKGDQLSVFFAGPILAGNLTRTVNDRFRVGIDLLASGLPGNNRLYSGSTEITKESVWVFEETVGLRAAWQPTTSLTISAASYLAYDYFRRTGDTDESFVLPHSGVTLMPNLELKYAKKGYIFTLGGTQARRLGWKQFGLGQELDAPAKQNYTKYFGDFSKSLYFGKFTKTGLNLSYYSGEHLDRFSRYQPSFFSSPRVRGIPTGTDTFDTLAVAGISHGFNIMDFIKFEGSYNHAWARNRAESPTFQAYDGLDFEFGTAGPWGTYMQGIVTYALKGNLGRYNSPFGVYLLIMKPLH